MQSPLGSIYMYIPFSSTSTKFNTNFTHAQALYKHYTPAHQTKQFWFCAYKNSVT